MAGSSWSRRARITLLAIAAWLPSALLAAGAKAYVGNFADDTVSVVDIDRLAVVATIPVAKGPHGLVATRDGRRVYVSGDGSTSVQAIDVATDRVVSTIDVGPSPHGLAVVPGGSLLLVGVYGRDEIAIVDTTTDAVVARVPVAKPHTIAVRPDGLIAYAASQAPGDFAIVAIDLASRAVVRRLSLAKPPRDLEFAHDGRAMYFTQAGVDAVQVFDPASERVTAEIPTGPSPHIATSFRGAGAGMAVVQGPGEVLLFDVGTNQPLRSIAVGRQPHWIASARDGRLVLVTNEGSNDLAAIDPATGVVGTVAVGRAPRKVTVASGGVFAAAVTIDRFVFTPEVLEVEAGATVTWTNADGSPHGITFEDGRAGEPLLLPGARTARAFDTPGEHAYACPIHPFMRGRVRVRAARPVARSSP